MQKFGNPWYWPTTKRFLPKKTYSTSLCCFERGARERKKFTSIAIASAAKQKKNMSCSGLMTATVLIIQNKQNNDQLKKSTGKNQSECSNNECTPRGMGNRKDCYWSASEQKMQENAKADFFSTPKTSVEKTTPTTQAGNLSVNKESNDSHNWLPVYRMGVFAEMIGRLDQFQ